MRRAGSNETVSIRLTPEGTIECDDLDLYLSVMKMMKMQDADPFTAVNIGLFSALALAGHRIDRLEREVSLILAAIMEAKGGGSEEAESDAEGADSAGAGSVPSVPASAGEGGD